MISPVLANLFLHYVFDDFISKEFPNIPWVRYADDGCLNCVSLKQAEYMINVLDKRFKLFGLELNLTKTKIVYCKDSYRKGNYENITFDFLGYTFKPREAKGKQGNRFTSFLPAMSTKAQKAIRTEVRSWRLQDNTHVAIEEIAQKYNSKIQGWINYYTHYYKSAISDVMRYINFCLVKWIRHKYKKLRTIQKARKWLKKVYENNHNLFAHWKIGIIDITVKR